MEAAVNECNKTSKIHVFLSTILSVYIFSLVIALTFELVFKYLRSKGSPVIKKLNNSKFKKIQWKARHLLWGESKASKLFVSLVLLMSWISFLRFAIWPLDYQSFVSWPREVCFRFFESPISIIDVLLNTFFLVYFIIRLISSSNKFWFMFEIYSFVDFMTIPSAFVVIYLDRTWIGFKFLRAVMLWHFPALLTKFNVIKSNVWLLFVKVLTAYMIIVLVASGAILLFENAGDPFDFSNGHQVYYGPTIAFVILITTTIDINGGFVRTVSGQTVVYILIIGLVITILWFLLKLLARNGLINTDYKQSFATKSMAAHKFVIIGGHLSETNLKPFLHDFYHKNKKNKDIEVVLVAQDLTKLEGLSSGQYSSKVTFLEGSVLSHHDLKRLKADKADKCILLADKHAKDIEDEDASNIMRVMSVKKFCPQLPIIVQLIGSQNKYYLRQIPDWSPNRGDKVLVGSQLRLRMIGQSCLAPGLTTLVANLVSSESAPLTHTKHELQIHYTRATKMQIFVDYLSPAFEEMSFAQTAALCFTKFKILLLAIQRTSDSDILVNPKPYHKIENNTKAFFIADDKDSVKRATWFCNKCHKDIIDVKTIRKCECLRVEDPMKRKYIHEMGFDSEDDKPEEINLLHLTSHPIDEREGTRDCESKTGDAKKTKDKSKAKKDKKAKKKKRKDSTSSSSSADSRSQSELKSESTPETGSDSDGVYDASASFHYCPKRSIDSCTVTADSHLLSQLNEHVIVGVLADQHSPLIGLKDLILTLRTSNIDLADLKPVLIVANIDLVRREWTQLQNIPQIYVFDGSLLSRQTLNDINLIVCNICVILCPNTYNASDRDSQLADKLSILADINVKTFTFDDSKLSLLSLQKRDETCAKERPRLELRRKGSEYYMNIPVITELGIHSDLDNERNERIANGTLFINSFIDSLTSLAQSSPDTVGLIETLASGGLTSKAEQLLNRSECLESKPLSSETLRNRDRSRVIQMALKGALSPYRQSNYGKLFIEALESYGVLCLGVYRLRESADPEVGPDVRYVITNPSQDFQLNENDLVFNRN